MATLPERVTTLETQVKFAGSISVLLILGAMAYLTSKVNSLSEDVQKIKQAEKDHGTEIVRQVQESNKPLEQRSALLAVAVDLQRAQQDKRTLDVEKLKSLADALRRTSRQMSPPQELWPAVSSFISLRSAVVASETTSGEQVSCWDKVGNPRTPPINPTIPSQNVGYRIDETSCLVDLNDISAFERFRSRVRPFDSVPSQSSRIFLHVIGGKVRWNPDLPTADLQELTCEQCAVAVSSPLTPPRPESEKLLRAFLDSPADAITLPVGPGAS